MEDKERYIEFFKLNKTYETSKGPFVVVEDFDLTIKKGEFISLIGHSGCGKSTVLTMMAGLNEITSGQITLDHKEIEGPGPDRGVVFQAPSLLPWMSVFQNVMLGVKKVFPHATKQEKKMIVDYYLDKVGLLDSANKLPMELSGGMKQRVGLARAFALNPKMLLLDEPFGMLDSLTRYELQDVLIELWGKDQKTALMVTHDVDEAIFLSDRIVMMTNGPHAKVGKVLEINIPRPRKRLEVIEHPDYYRYREELIGFLTSQEHEKEQAAKQTPSSDSKTDLDSVQSKK